MRFQETFYNYILFLMDNIPFFKGVTLSPGNLGNDCIYNGLHKDIFGRTIECCCDECNFLLCCIPENNKNKCENCTQKYCPFSDDYDNDPFYN